jgi:hypothetical protein
MQEAVPGLFDPAWRGEAVPDSDGPGGFVDGERALEGRAVEKPIRAAAAVQMPSSSEKPVRTTSRSGR